MSKARTKRSRVTRDPNALSTFELMKLFACNPRLSRDLSKESAEQLACDLVRACARTAQRPPTDGQVANLLMEIGAADSDVLSTVTWN
jgi:hypothetical protein